MLRHTCKHVVFRDQFQGQSHKTFNL